MRAAFYKGTRRFTTGEMAPPRPGPDDALLRVRRVGICGTDLHIFQGHLVFGGGPIGTLIALVARHRGARVAVVEVNPFRLEILKGFALERVGPDTDVVAWADQWTDGTGVDIAFEVTGNPVAASTVADVVRVWGTVSIVAIHAESVPVNLYQMFARELVMHGSRLYARSDWEEAIRLVASGAVPVAPLVSRRIPLDALQRGMEEALGGGPVMKVLVEV
jgi:threonine dehydrogenase-like Zn-dependent dehydrogenase